MAWTDDERSEDDGEEIAGVNVSDLSADELYQLAIQSDEEQDEWFSGQMFNELGNLAARAVRWRDLREPPHA